MNLCVPEAQCGIVCTTGHEQCCNNTQPGDCSNMGGGPPIPDCDPYLGYCGQDAQYGAGGFELECRNSEGSLLAPCPVSASIGETVVDNLSGLEWQRYVGPETYSWVEAANHCEMLTYAGKTDWRLPTPHESVGFVDYGAASTLFAAPAFPSTQGDFWTSVETVKTQGTYWTLTSDGRMHQEVGSLGQRAICVRETDGSHYGGEDNALRYLESDLDVPVQIVFDSITGLTWIGSHPEIASSWPEALEYCETLEYAGFDDWRLPDIKELVSLVDYSHSGPSSTFPVMDDGEYWASTPSITNCEVRWIVSFSSGAFSSGGYSNVTRSVKCVRN